MMVAVPHVKGVSKGSGANGSQLGVGGNKVSRLRRLRIEVNPKGIVVEEARLLMGEG